MIVNCSVKYQFSVVFSAEYDQAPESEDQCIVTAKKQDAHEETLWVFSL